MNQKTVDVKAWAAVLEKLPEAESKAIVRHLEVAAQLIESATKAAEGWKAQAEQAKRQCNKAHNALAVVADELGAWRIWAKATHEGDQAAIEAAAKGIETATKATWAMLVEVYGGEMEVFRGKMP